MKQPQQRINPNKLKSHEIGQLIIDNWKRIDYVCRRQNDRVTSAIRQGRKYDEVVTIEWQSPEGLQFLLFIDYRHQIPVLIHCIVGGTEQRPQFLFPQNYIDTDSGQIDLYTCHFMERYQQRCTKLQLPMKEIVKRYALANISNICIWRNEADDRRVFAVRQGLIFAKADREYNRWIYTTYVSNDMLGESQRESKAVIQELLDRQDTLFNGTRQYHPLEWYMLDEYITVRLRELRPQAEEIYNRYFEDADE